MSLLFGNRNKMNMDITFLGYSPRTYPVLLEIASAALGIDASDLKVQVVSNLPQTQGFAPPESPESWASPEFLHISEWNSDDRGILLPGVMREPAVSKVWEAFHHLRGIRREHLGTMVHPSAVISPSAQIGEGTWIHPNVTIWSMSRIGFCCHVNRNSSLAHHSILGDFSRLNAGVHTSGYCEIGMRTTLGSGSCTKENIKIGNDCFVGAGAVVVKNGPDGHLGIGVPVRWSPRTDLNDF